MVEEVASESEKVQIQRIVTLQKVAWGIVLKWKWLFLLLLLALGGGFAFWLNFKSATSLSRFEATTRLLFIPRKDAKIDNISDRELMSIIERESLKARVLSKLGGGNSAWMTGGKMEIEQERRPTNLFTLTVTAPTASEAVRKANVYADELIKEYVAYRTVDLENKLESIKAQQKKEMERLAENEAEIAQLKAKTGVASPSDTLATLNSLISDQRRNLSSLGVQMTNEDLRCRKLDEVVGDMGPVIIANAAAIRRRAEAIASLDKELAALRVEYTDLNPKVMGKVQDRGNLVKELQEFLRSKGVEDFDAERIDEIEKAAGELADCGTRIDALKERQRALEQELKDNEKKAELLTSQVPTYQHLLVRHDELVQTTTKLSDDVYNIESRMKVLHKDLRQIERAESVADNGGFAVKMIALAVFGSVICVGAVLLWVLLLEFLFGNVRGGKELASYDSVKFLCSLPKAKRHLTDEDREVLGVAALRLLGADAPRGVMLISILPGASYDAEFEEVLDYTASMSGVRVFTLNVVSSGTFTPPEGVEQMIGTCRKGTKGWFPVLNRYALAPTELEMLRADIAELRKSFDTVFVRMEGGFRKGGTFFDQLLSVSETVVLIVGTAKTPRSWFSYLRRHVEAAGKPMLAMVTDASKGVVRAEMEAQ